VKNQLLYFYGNLRDGFRVSIQIFLNDCRVAAPVKVIENMKKQNAATVEKPMLFTAIQ